MIGRVVKTLLHLKFLKLYSFIFLFASIVWTGAVQVFAGPILIVGASESYKTISEAVAAAPEGATIYIKNGEYTESVKVYKNISIIGESREGVKLSFPCTYYAYPPLEAGCGVFKNLTITATSSPQYAGTTAYAVHCDRLIAQIGSSIYFENCSFESKGMWDLGIGSGDRFTVTFNNCAINGNGLFYHTYGDYHTKAFSSVLNIYNCTFSPGSTVTINNCYAQKSNLTVNLHGNLFNKPPVITSSPDCGLGLPSTYNITVNQS